MGQIILAPRGTQDLWGDTAYCRHQIRERIRSIVELYGVCEIITPTFEATELFARSVGECTDVVQKEMYTFEDKSGRSITLRPEGTAGVVRACIQQNLLEKSLPLRLFYFVNCFRYDRPQAGRFRELNQFGVEVFGSASFRVDAEMIELMCRILNEFKVLEKSSLAINSIGCEHCRPAYQKALISYLESKRSGYCATCQERMEKNPLRVLDCKEEKCGILNASAPSVLDYLCKDCRAHFEGLKSCLKLDEITYRIDHNLVRGLDYYTRTVFEFEISKPEGGAMAVCGGGRYDKLVENLGGPETPAFGFGIGLERLQSLLLENGFDFESVRNIDVYIAGFDENSVRENKIAQDLTRDLRRAGISVERDMMKRSLKAQFKYADRNKAKFCVVVGEEEQVCGALTIKNLETAAEEKIPCEQVAKYLTEKLKATGGGKG